MKASTFQQLRDEIAEVVCSKSIEDRCKREINARIDELMTCLERDMITDFDI